MYVSPSPPGEKLHIYLIPFPPFLSLDISSRLRQKNLHPSSVNDEESRIRPRFSPYRVVQSGPPHYSPYGTKVGNETITFPEDFTSAKSLTPFFWFCFFSDHPFHFFFLNLSFFLKQSFYPFLTDELWCSSKPIIATSW